MKEFRLSLQHISWSADGKKKLKTHFLCFLINCDLQRIIMPFCFFTLMKIHKEHKVFKFKLFYLWDWKESIRCLRLAPYYCIDWVRLQGMTHFKSCVSVQAKMSQLTQKYFLRAIGQSLHNWRMLFCLFWELWHPVKFWLGWGGGHCQGFR